MTARLIAALGSLLVVSCGQPAAPTSAAPTSAVSVAVAPSATAIASGPVAASASPPAASDPVVLELRKATPEKTVSLTASGRVTRVTTSLLGDDDHTVGSVTPASVEAVHQALKAAHLCDLPPKVRESAPAYTILDAHFPDVACLVELPDPRWEKTPAAKKAIDAARRIEAEAFPRP